MVSEETASTARATAKVVFPSPGGLRNRMLEAESAQDKSLSCAICAGSWKTRTTVKPSF